MGRQGAYVVVVKKFDPYEVLGVPKDADDAAIKAAYRAAAKNTHPDATGDADTEDFQRVRHAQLVLLDPIKRRKFDATGDLDDDKPDNVRANALQVIEAFMGNVLGSYINSGFATHLDPRRRDLLADFREQTNGEISQVTMSIKGLEKTVVFLKDMLTRFESEDPSSPIERGIQRQIDNCEEQVLKAKEAIEFRRVALTIASSYSFTADAPTGTYEDIWPNGIAVTLR